jgi:outer membrane protein assembly factor BamB
MMSTWLAALLLAPLSPHSDRDWPGYRGDGTAAALCQRAPVMWSKTENILWEAPLPGRGPSSPVVAAGQVYVTANSGFRQDRLHVLAFDADSGKQLWERQLWATGRTECHPFSSMSAPTPATDGERVFALFATADLVCFDKAGNLLWYRALSQEYPSITNQVGMASSPVVAGETLIVPLENVGADSFCLALDVKTGKDKWKTSRQRELCWTTPAVARLGGRSVVLLQDNRSLLACDLETGKELWNFGGFRLHDIVGPVQIDTDRIGIAGDAFAVVRPGQEGTTPQIVWKTTRVRLGYCTPVVHGGSLYTLASNGVLQCLDAAEGTVRWQQRLKGSFAACPILAGDKLYLVNEEGTTYVVQADPKEAKVLATNALQDAMLATPAVYRNRIYLKSQTRLYCVGERK